MKLELKEYQVGAHEELLDEIDNAMSRHRKKSDKIFAISLATLCFKLNHRVIEGVR